MVWFVLARTIESRDVLTPVAEAWAVGCEAAVYALVFGSLGPARAVGVSAVANATSFLAGVALARFSL